MNTTAGYLSIIFYLLACALLSVKIRQNLSHVQVSKWLSPALFSIWALAIALHAIYLYLPLFQGDGLLMNLSYASAHTLCITNSVLLITLIRYRVELIGLFIIPLAIAFNVLNLLSAPDGLDGLYIYGALGWHILTSLLGYSLLALATAMAIVLYFQDRHLHNHTPNPMGSILPPLQAMERLLFHLLIAGVIFLGAGLLTGFIYLDDMFKQHVAHKTILSLLAFVTYSVLLFGHWRFGWRGKKAIRFTLLAFALLLTGFMGSKVVYEFLLN